MCAWKSGTTKQSSNMMCQQRESWRVVSSVRCVSKPKDTYFHIIGRHFIIPVKKSVICECVLEKATLQKVATWVNSLLIISWQSGKKGLSNSFFLSREYAFVMKNWLFKTKQWVHVVSKADVVRVLLACSDSQHSSRKGLGALFLNLMHCYYTWAPLINLPSSVCTTKTCMPLLFRSRNQYILFTKAQPY